MKNLLLGGLAVAALGMVALSGVGCGDTGGTDGGTVYSNYTIDSADFVSSGQGTETGNCAIGNTDGTTYPVVYDSTNGYLKVGTVGGNPAQASAGEGYITNDKGTLERDNTVTVLDGSGNPTGCTFTRKVENEVTVTADNTITSKYTRTDSNHAGCTGIAACSGGFTFTLKKK